MGQHLQEPSRLVNIQRTTYRALGADWPTTETSGRPDREMKGVTQAKQGAGRAGCSESRRECQEPLLDPKQLGAPGVWEGCKVTPGDVPFCPASTLRTVRDTLQLQGARLDLGRRAHPALDVWSRVQGSDGALCFLLVLTLPPRVSRGHQEFPLIWLLSSDLPSMVPPSGKERPFERIASSVGNSHVSEKGARSSPG